MAETLTLTAPISVTGYQVQVLVLDRRASQIKVIVSDSNGDLVTCTYAGQTASDLMVQLNKLDMSTTSLHKRILQRLVNDGKLPAGTVTGSPD